MSKKTSNKLGEKRNFTFEIRAEENDNGKAIITGEPIVFEQKTDICGCFSESIRSGALLETDLTDVPLLANHNFDMIPVARSRRNNGNSTMTLTSEKNRFTFKAELDIENNLTARELYSAIKRGDISGMSFCFDIEEEKWSEENSDYPHRDILKIGKVYEISAVTFPAYEGTSISARAMDIDQAKNILEKMRKRSGDFATECEELNKLKLQIAIQSEL